MNPKLCMFHPEVVYEALAASKTDEPVDEEGKTSASKMLSSLRIRVYNTNPRFLEERQTRAARQFKQMLAAERSLEEFKDEQEEQ